MKNICIIGCGDIAKSHAKILQGKARLYFYSQKLASAQRFQKTFHGHGTFESFEAVLADQNIHALLICSPPQAHKDQIIQALQAGKHVLVEKPFVCSQDELKEVQQSAARHKNQWVMVAENYHYKSSLAKLKKIISSDVIGSVQKVFIRKMFTQPSPGWKSEYGALFEGGIHFIAFLSELMHGKAPISIQANFPSDSKPERTSHLVLNYDQGVQAHIDYSWETPHWLQGVLQHSHVVGEKGVITFESNGLYIQTPNGFKFGGLKDLSGRKKMLDNFLDCLNNPTQQPSYGLEAASRDMNIVFQAYSHGQTVPRIQK